MTADKTDLLDFQHYMRKSHFKTASLIANSAKAVAILGGAPRRDVQLAYDYGAHLGLAFQLIDDVLVRWLSAAPPCRVRVPAALRRASAAELCSATPPGFHGLRRVTG